MKVLRQGREAGVLSAEHFGWDVESTWLKGNASNHSMCFKAFGLLAVPRLCRVQSRSSQNRPKQP